MIPYILISSSGIFWHVAQVARSQRSESFAVLFAEGFALFDPQVPESIVRAEHCEREIIFAESQ